MNDIILQNENFVFDYRVAGILVQNDKVLLQSPKNTGIYAFPGGHVALGEISTATLTREWYEEIEADIKIGELKWVQENFISWSDKLYHQICLYYEVALKDEIQIPLDGCFISKEYDLNDEKAIWCHWISLDEVINFTVYPTKAVELLPCLNESVKHFVSQ